MTESFAFIVHQGKETASREAGRMEKKLLERGMKVLYPQTGEKAEQYRMVVTFGGDGTLLMGARTALEHHCPLLGINLGTVGFLTEGDPCETDRFIGAILDKRYSLEQRSLLEVRINDRKEKYLALNDAVVTRGGFARLIQVETRINQEYWGTFTADGVIAATPTGSTGYSLSAGGPVVAPGVKCMVISPVCAHSLQHCPCIVPPDARIVFHLREGREHQAQLQIDGQNLHTLSAGDEVHVTGAEETLQLVRIKKYQFFTVLQTKLNEWSCRREEELDI